MIGEEGAKWYSWSVFGCFLWMTLSRWRGSAPLRRCLCITRAGKDSYWWGRSRRSKKSVFVRVRKWSSFLHSRCEQTSTPLHQKPILWNPTSSPNLGVTVQVKIKMQCLLDIVTRACGWSSCIDVFGCWVGSIAQVWCKQSLPKPQALFLKHWFIP